MTPTRYHLKLVVEIDVVVRRPQSREECAQMFSDGLNRLLNQMGAEGSSLSEPGTLTMKGEIDEAPPPEPPHEQLKGPIPN